MATYTVSKSFRWQEEISSKAASLMQMFGLSADSVAERSVEHSCQIEVGAGDVVYLTGPSGSGKSVILRELEASIEAGSRINLADIELYDDRLLVDCLDGDLINSLRFFSLAGLSDCLCLLNKPANLSEGQKWRYRLAMAMSEGKEFVFADEFCTNLDRITASVIAFNVRRFAKRNGVTFILAGSNDDMLRDLLPDVLVVRELSGDTKVIYKRGSNGS